VALPVIPLPSSVVEVNGAPVPFRSLSRSEALALQDFRGREDEAEVYILVAATGCTEEEAQAFREGTMTMEAGKLIDAILVLSGLAEGTDPAGDPIDPKAATNGRSRTARSTAVRS
jgi:hypothetical protein